jgi:kynurenine formamidase
VIDLSLPIHPAMLHGGGHPQRDVVAAMADGKLANVTRWLLSAHAGTHVEAPLHTISGGAAVDELSLDLLVGPARVLDLTAVTTEITAADLEAAGLDDDARVLLKTTNSAGALRRSEKAEDWIGLAPDAAQLLVGRGVRLVGIDYLTLEAPSREATFDAHRILNAAGVVIIESVDLLAAEPGPHELVCLPLLIEGAEAAPARVLLGPPRTPPATEMIDLSVRISEQMPAWGMRPQRTVVEALEEGGACNVTRWYMGVHTGTHLDAPLHHHREGAPIESMALERFVGPARVLDLTALTEDVTAADLDAAGLGDAKRVLLRTVNSAGALHAAQRPATWIGLAPDGARLLAQRGVELVGLDFLTLDGPHQTATGWDSHNLVCAAGMLVLEGIDLRDVPAGDYELTALPIPLLDAEGAPGRAFLRPFEA